MCVSNYDCVIPYIKRSISDVREWQSRCFIDIAIKTLSPISQHVTLSRWCTVIQLRLSLVTAHYQVAMRLSCPSIPRSRIRQDLSRNIFKLFPPNFFNIFIIPTYLLIPCYYVFVHFFNSRDIDALSFSFSFSLSFSLSQEILVYTILTYQNILSQNREGELIYQY